MQKQLSCVKRPSSRNYHYLGKHHVKVLRDGWTAVTRDRSLTAQFEHSVGVTETGVDIFTTSPAGLHKPTSIVE